MTKPTADDLLWLLNRTGFTLRELIFGVNPRDLSPTDVETYSRLLRAGLEEPEPEPEDDEDSEEDEDIHAPAELPEDAENPSKGGEPDPQTNLGILLALVREQPGELTSFYANEFSRRGGNRASTNAQLNSLRSKGLITSNKKSSKNYRWYPRKAR